MRAMSESLVPAAAPPRARRDRGALLLGGLALYALSYAIWLLTSTLPARERSLSQRRRLPPGRPGGRPAGGPNGARRGARPRHAPGLAVPRHGLRVPLARRRPLVRRPLAVAEQRGGLHRRPVRLRRLLCAGPARPAVVPPLSADAVGVPPVLARRRDRLPRRPDAPLVGPAGADRRARHGRAGDVPADDRLHDGRSRPHLRSRRRRRPPPHGGRTVRAAAAGDRDRGDAAQRHALQRLRGRRRAIPERHDRWT